MKMIKMEVFYIMSCTKIMIVRMHMSETECRSCIDLYLQLEDGEINEWEIGGDE